MALGWPGALGIYAGTGFKVAGCIGNLVWDWQWNGQVHWETLWAVILEWPVALELAVGMALAWPGALENAVGMARDCRLHWESVRRLPLEWPVALGLWF